MVSLPWTVHDGVIMGLDQGVSKRKWLERGMLCGSPDVLPSCFAAESCRALRQGEHRETVCCGWPLRARMRPLLESTDMGSCMVVRRAPMSRNHARGAPPDSRVAFHVAHAVRESRS